LTGLESGCYFERDVVSKKYGTKKIGCDRNNKKCTPIFFKSKMKKKNVFSKIIKIFCSKFSKIFQTFFSKNPRKKIGKNNLLQKLPIFF